MMRVAVALLCLVLLVAGCGSKKDEKPVNVPSLLAPARTPDEWAQRVVNRLLRPLSQDLPVITNFASAQVRAYIVTGNEQALQTIHARLGDLQKCTQKLDIIGKPPGGQEALRRVDERLRTACASYEDVADKLLKATDLLASGKADKVVEGEKLQASAGKPSRAAAEALSAGIKTAQSLAPFRRAGLQPSV
jgi:hypothetical protein